MLLNDVLYLSDNVFELAFLPGIRWVIHHSDDGIVIFLILVIEEHKFSPEVGLLSCPENLTHKQTSSQI